MFLWKLKRIWNRTYQAGNERFRLYPLNLMLTTCEEHQIKH